MIADGNVLVVGQQRIVGAEQFADIGGVMDADVEIGVVRDARGQVQRGFGHRHQQRFDLRALGRAFGQERGDTAAQRAARAGTQGQQGIERFAGSGAGGVQRIAFEQGRGGQRAEVEDHVPDGDAAPGSFIAAREDAEGQVLDRKIAVAVRAFDPGAQSAVMGFVDRGHGLTSSVGAGRP